MLGGQGFSGFRQAETRRLALTSLQASGHAMWFTGGGSAESLGVGGPGAGDGRVYSPLSHYAW